MIKINDFNRDELTEQYVGAILDGMDSDTLYTFAYEHLMSEKDLLTNEVLENEINEFYPYILEQS